MQIISNKSDFAITEPTVVAIGKFDGDHIGHQKVFSVMRQVKADEMLRSAAFSFAFFDVPQISTLPEKRKLLSGEGIDYLIEYPFDEHIKNMEAEDFVRRVLLGMVNMKHIVAGTDCSFGHNRSGNAELLISLAPELGYKVTIIDKVCDGDHEISSTSVRDMIRSGDVEDAASLMGRPYSVRGIVRAGNRLGKTRLGFATANIMPDDGKLFPREGVYFTRTILPDGSRRYSMTNIGSNPSIDADSLGHIIRCETHIFGFEDDLYGNFIEIEFLKYLRDEIRFDSMDTLTEQLNTDMDICLSLIGRE